MEFTADGRYTVATCEFSSQLVKIDLETRAVVGYLKLGGAPSNPLKKLGAALLGKRTPIGRRGLYRTLSAHVRLVDREAGYHQGCNEVEGTARSVEPANSGILMVDTPHFTACSPDSPR